MSVDLSGNERIPGVVLDEDGDDPVMPPEVRWTFATRGSDSIYVDCFTVSYRFLAAT